VFAEEPGVRVFWVVAGSMQSLVDRLALVLSERMRDNDELHVTYNAMQSGWQHDPGHPGDWRHAARTPYTHLHFEYSAFVVMRQRGEPVPPIASSDDVVDGLED
jgi:hypothetical protein